MLHRQRKMVASLATCALFACTGLVRADQSNSTFQSRSPSLSLSDPQYMDQAATAPATEPASAPATAPAAPGPTSVLGLGITAIGGGFLSADPYDFKFTGFVEGSYTTAFQDPPGHLLPGRVFDFQSDKVILDQVDLSVERDVDFTKAAKGKMDFGGKIEFIYGGDAGLTHSAGIFDNFNGPHDPDNQPDLLQAYADVLVPVGSGLDIRMGKFVTLLGYETINPTTNPLFSHSYEFGFGIPFTQTGVLGIYNFNSQWTLTAGVTDGWNQSTTDTHNGALDFLGQIKYVKDPTLTLLTNVSIGPERFEDAHDYRFMLESNAIYTPANSAWTFGLDPFFAADAHGANNGDTAYWYGVVGYAGYKIDDYFTVNGRLEWYRDDGGETFASSGSASYYEGTLGVTIKPFPSSLIGQNLMIRPEVRYDFSNRRFFDGGTEKDQTTVGVDAIFQL